MELGIVTICIGSCPIVFLARIPSLAVVTICLMWLSRKIIKQFSPHHNRYRALKVLAVSTLLLLCGLASIVANHILFSLIVNLIGGGGFCTGRVHASPLETCIPLLGALYVLTKKGKPEAKLLHVLLKILFIVDMSLTLYYSILWNLIIYDAWGLDLIWPYHGDYVIYLKYEARIEIFLAGIVTYCALIFSILANLSLVLLKLRRPIAKIFLFILGLFISFALPQYCDLKLFQSLAKEGFPISIYPGIFTIFISPTIFLLTTFVMNTKKERIYDFWNRFSKIRAVKKNAKFSLEQIKIASPCPASWEEMIGDNTVRFCQICSKNVYNLSSMKTVEAQTLVMNKQGKLCGLLYLRKDGSVMTSDCPVGFGEIRRRLIKRVAKVAGAAFALIGLQQFFVGDRSLRSQSKASNKTLEPAQLDELKTEQLETLGALGYIAE
ncbi:MAG TPA: hypothetical protein VH815_13520 [Acidobacteriota bacterium]